MKKSAPRELGALPRPACARLVLKIRALGANPRPHGCEKLAGDEKHRLRRGVYRILFSIDDATRTVTIVKIAQRRAADR
jgi:mRNA interferase RelE/StbE